METLIVSRTRTGHGKCIGGIVLRDNRSVRLVQANGSYWPDDCDLEIGEIWNINFHQRLGITAPFVEDVIVENRVYVRDIDSVRLYVLSQLDQIRNFYWEGSINSMYEGRVDFQTSNNRAYIDVGNEPAMSTGFWVPNVDLILQQDNKHYSCGWQVLVYVGDVAPLLRIPAGTLCRVSLARSIKPHPDFVGPDRYYVQLSGWYN